MTTWVKWAGGEMPVAGGTLVDIRFGNGRTVMATRADRWLWGAPRREDGKPNRLETYGGAIVAYRELESA